MSFGFHDLLSILGSLAFFIYGMKVMSEGIQRAAGSQLRNILRSMTRHRILGILTGFLTTAIVQSSSATTVMTVSFVNAGLITLYESAGIMMGANVGTTITGWLVSVLGFNIQLHQLSLPLLVVGVPMLLAPREKIRYWGEFIVGFCLLFLGLYFLQTTMPDIRNNPEALTWLTKFTDKGFLSRIFFVFVGAFITIVIQSSSASMTLTLTMCYNGWLPFDVAAAMVLGENIGTTITAEVAALVGNSEARRSARIHSLFNLIGVSWMLLLIPSVINGLASIMIYLNFGDPFNSSTVLPLAISAFHSTFNIANMILLVGFTPWLVKLATRTVKERSVKKEQKKYHLQYINSGSRTPELGIMEAQKEVAKFAEVTSRMSGFVKKLLLPTTPIGDRIELLDRLKKYEIITDNIEIELIEYLTKLSSEEHSERLSIRIRSIMNICNELERIGDLYYEMGKTLERKIEDKIWFTQHQRDRLDELFLLVDEAFSIAINNLSTPQYDKVSKVVAYATEKKINTLHNKLRSENLEDLEKGEYNMQSAMLYNNLFSNMEKIGDHLENITESVVGEI